MASTDQELGRQQATGKLNRRAICLTMVVAAFLGMISFFVWDSKYAVADDQIISFDVGCVKDRGAFEVDCAVSNRGHGFKTFSKWLVSQLPPSRRQGYVSAETALRSSGGKIKMQAPDLGEIKKGSVVRVTRPESYWSQEKGTVATVAKGGDSYPTIVRFDRVNYAGTSTANFALDELVLVSNPPAKGKAEARVPPLTTRRQAVIAGASLAPSLVLPQYAARADNIEDIARRSNAAASEAREAKKKAAEGSFLGDAVKGVVDIAVPAALLAIVGGVAVFAGGLLGQTDAVDAFIESKKEKRRPLTAAEKAKYSKLSAKEKRELGIKGL